METETIISNRRDYIIDTLKHPLLFSKPVNFSNYG